MRAKLLETERVEALQEEIAGFLLDQVINPKGEYYYPLPLLGNVVISKKFLRTRKIMVMHSNERGECCLRTLVDRKWKCYDNAVDVVIRSVR